MRLNKIRKGAGRKQIALGALEGVHLGFVRQTDDFQRMGRLKVWVPELGADQEGSWIRVSYASPFAGTTPITDTKTNSKAEDGAQQSYGWWAVPPHIGNQVLITFVNNDPSRGYWFACVYPQNMNSMVPGVGMNLSTDDEINSAFSPFAPPTVEYNKKDESIDPNKPSRPANSALAKSLISQGLTHDFERGVGNSSARREDTSKVNGFLTPGGNSMVFDDAEDNSFIRFRTKSGAQILIHETSGYIYMITKGGKSWMEISDGGIDAYSAAPISVRSEADINIQADANLNLDAKGNINIRAGGSIRSFSAGNTDFAVNGNYTMQAGGKGSLSSGSHMAIGAGGSFGLQASADIVSESGGKNVRNAAQILDNSGGGGGPTPEQAQFKETAAIGGRETVASRAPTHEPYAHPITSTHQYNPGGVGTVQLGDGTVSEGVTEPDNSPVQNISGYNISDNVNGAIYEAARKTNVPYENLMAIVAAESGFDPNAGASTSSAKGLFQFTGPTFATMFQKYGPNGTVEKNPGTQNSPYHPATNALFGAYLYKENVKSLEAAGLSAAPTDVYILNFLGDAGGKRFLRAKSKTPNGSALDAASAASVQANLPIFRKNNGIGDPRTVNEVYNVMFGKVGKTVPQWENYKKEKQAVSSIGS